MVVFPQMAEREGAGLGVGTPQLLQRDGRAGGAGGGGGHSTPAFNQGQPCLRGEVSFLRHEAGELVY